MRPKKAQQIATINETPGDVQKGYLAKWLVVCTFPHRDPKEPLFSRTNGDYTLTIQSGTDKGQFIGLPYGALVRLLLFWIITECNRLKWTGDTSRRIHLGESMAGFLRVTGLDPKTGNGKRGDAKRLRAMMHRLFRCRISFTKEQGASGASGFSWLDMDVAPKGELWWDVKNPDQATLFESWIEVGAEFYKAVTENPIPIDFRALVALKHSPMAMDLYAWLTWRVHAMKDGGSVEIPLHGAKGLAAQIGSEYKQRQHFKAAVEEGLQAVGQVWPQLNCNLSATHLTISKSLVPISDVSPIKKRRKFGEVPADRLSIETALWFKTTFPKYDGKAVERSFRAFLAKNKITPHDIDAMFKDYAAKWVSGEH